MKLINKIKERLNRKLNNQGSSIVMVVVALGFIGIIVGALLMAAGSAYRLKLQQMYAQDNFYYVEQAMQEIYASVGTQTVTEMKDAYTHTLENMVYYDVELGTYVTISDEEANEMFKKQFMNNIKGSSYFGQSTSDLADNLETAITNDTVKLDKDKLSIVQTDTTITIKDVTLTRTQEYAKSVASGTYTQTVSADIVISEPDFEVDFNNFAMDYSTIFDYAMVADMGVEVHQNSGTPLTITGNIYAASDYYNKAYNWGLDDKGVDSANLIDGSFSAGVDEDGKITSNKVKGTYTVNEDGQNVDKELEYDLVGVSNKSLLPSIGNEKKDGLVNDDVYGDYTDAQGNLYKFDGENERSKYSGLYITGSNVSIMADSVIVPGSIAVMNTSELTVYGMSGSQTLPQVWADDIVLGGTSTGKKEGTSSEYTYTGSQATFRANLFVKDDTQIDAEGSSFTLSGSYYGYGDGTSSDSRQFIATVDPDHFKMVKRDEDNNVVYKKGDGETTVVAQADKDENGNPIPVYDFNRGHFNSSSIVVNGQNSNLDLSATQEIFIAGRAYVELSKYGTTSTSDGDDASSNVKTTTYEYVKDASGHTGFVEDYKTGESISTKTSQLIYIVSNFGTLSSVINGNITPYVLYSAVDIPDTWNGVGFDDDPDDKVVGFGDFFPKEIFQGKLPVKKETIKGRDYIFIDFDTAYNDVIKAAADMTINPALPASTQQTLTTSKNIASAIVAKYSSADEFQSAYAVFYAAESLKGETSNYVSMLSNIYAYSDFTQGDIILPATSTSAGIDFSSEIYSSGAISMKLGNSFTMTTVDKELSDGTSVVNNLMLDTNLASYKDSVITQTNEALKVASLSDDLETEYNYMKWNLAHYKENNVEKSYVKDLVKKYGEDAITPINRYMQFSNIGVETESKAGDGHKVSDVKNYVVNGGSDNGTAYRIWASEDDIVVDDEYITTVIDEDGNSVAKTIKNANVTGIIITKGDVSFSDNVKSFTGMIIAGGKIYVGKNMTNISSASATCREILRQCASSDAAECVYFINIFKEYNSKEDSSGEAAAGKENKVGIDTIGYTDVVSVENWIKNVGGAYDEN